MAFNPSNFTSRFTPARSDLFRVTISPPNNPGLSNFLNSMDLMRFTAETAEMPGKNLLSFDHKHYGPINKIPYGVSFVDTTIGFVVNEDLREIEFFNQWQDFISGNSRTHQNFNSKSFEMTYHDDITCNVLMETFSTTGVPTRKQQLVDAYPIIVSPIALGWNASNRMSLNVTFTYRLFRDLLVDLKTPKSDDDLEVGEAEAGDFVNGVQQNDTAQSAFEQSNAWADKYMKNKGAVNPE